MEFWTIILLVLVAALVYALVTRPKAQPVPEPQRTNVGELTLETLRFYSGYDFTRPTLIAVKGKIYDVSDDARFAPPNGELRALAGRECARALAKGSTAEADLSDVLDDLSQQEVEALDTKLAELEASCRGPAGQVVPMQELTPQQLARHDGSDVSLPLYLAIRGTVYDITKGKHFYGPDGVYPFAGKEVARAFALLSTDLKDCCDDLSGLAYAEQENLREWTQRFNAKYPIVGKLVKGAEASQQQQQQGQQ